MIKIFVTGDNHIGLSYMAYPGDVRDRLVESRFSALERAVSAAEEEGCGIFAVTGDLFDRNSGVPGKDIERTADILGAFPGIVLIIPGNHDYCTGEENLWKDFKDILFSRGWSSIMVLDEYRRYDIETGGEKAAVYPAFCASKHSERNSLGWIKKADTDPSVYNIGMAHGSIEGVSPDMKNEYFLMSERELEDIPMDVWLIGHTHVMYPGDIPEDRFEETGRKVFNPGTHEQTDISNNTEGNCFIVKMDRNGTGVELSVKRRVTGEVSFRRIRVTVESGERLGDAIEEELHEALEDAGSTVVRLSVSGSAAEDDYRRRRSVYDSCLSSCLYYDVDDEELAEEITDVKIRSEFPETSFAYSFLRALEDDPRELQMAYELVGECMEEKK